MVSTLRFAVAMSLLSLAACSSAGPGGDPVVHGDPTSNGDPPSCGVGPLPSHGDTATVSEDGTVVFNPIAVGATATFMMPVKESADTDETIIAASSTNGAFKIVSPVPIYVPRGQAVMVEVSFAPESSGPISSDLVLSTAKMGNSHVALAGTGL
jgi:hypothetical protein